MMLFGRWRGAPWASRVCKNLHFFPHEAFPETTADLRHALGALLLDLDLHCQTNQMKSETNQTGSKQQMWKNLWESVRNRICDSYWHKSCCMRMESLVAFLYLWSTCRFVALTVETRDNMENCTRSTVASEFFLRVECFACKSPAARQRSTARSAAFSRRNVSSSACSASWVNAAWRDEDCLHKSSQICWIVWQGHPKVQNIKLNDIQNCFRPQAASECKQQLAGDTWGPQIAPIKWQRLSKLCSDVHHTQSRSLLLV